MAVSPEARSRPTYLDWNDALAAYFFMPGMAGRAVYLYVNEDVINEVGTPLGGGVPEFTAAVRQGPSWVTKTSLCQRALQAYEGWRARGCDFPPYLGYLALFVLAAGLPGDFAAHAYYPRLRAMLGDPGYGMLPSFDRMLQLWDDLERWSVQDRTGELGIFEAKTAGRWIHVGLPVAQTILTSGERSSLPEIFACAELDPLSPPTSGELLGALRTYGPGLLRARTVSLAAERRDPDAVEALLDIVSERLASWDGEVEDAANNQNDRAHRVRASLRLCLALDPVAGRANASLRARSQRPFPEPGLALGIVGQLPTVSSQEAVPGWSTALADIMTGRPFEPPDVAWLGGLRLIDQEIGWELIMRASHVRVFAEGTAEGLAGLVETFELPRGKPFYVTFHAMHAAAIHEWTEHGCRGWQDLAITAGIPAGWTLGRAEEALSDREVRESFPSLAFPERLRLRFSGGIRSSVGNSFFAFAPPAIVVDGQVGDEEVWCDSARLETGQGGSFQLPDGLPTDTRIAVEVRRGDQTMKRTSIYLTASSPWRMAKPIQRVDQWGQPVAEPAAGAVSISGALIDLPAPVTRFRPDPLQAPGLGPGSRRIFLIGRRPGEICRWPADRLPAGWAAVWAVPMTRRGRAMYCGCNLEDAGPLPAIRAGGNRLLWKKVMWHWRRRIAPPRNLALAALWRQYQEVARGG